MADKRYYWLKLEENFFEDDTVQYLEEQENGKDYVIFYLKLALRSLKDDGKLIRYVGEKLIPYDVKALSKITGTPVDTVAVAMKTFLEIGLVERLESGEIFLSQIDEMVGSETSTAKRVRKHRARQSIENENAKVLHCNSQVTKCNTEKEKEKELEYRDKSIDIEKEKPSKADALNDEFEKWWELYGKIGNRKPALQKFKTCRKKHSLEQIINGTNEYLKTINDKRFQKHGSTFLNAEAYMDEYSHDSNYNIGARNEVASMEEELGIKRETSRELTEEELSELDREELPF